MLIDLLKLHGCAADYGRQWTMRPRFYERVFKKEARMSPRGPTRAHKEKGQP
ncbi:protein of unknown function [Methylocaldum szegediense]|uniref:Transposase n=1 Tax=Methylocaldum szegediense TaxID=73780 RepID=A0ABM9HW49_9GAMM|nr:protein of unknown function [Methylocaldum szegediense]